MDSAYKRLVRLQNSLSVLYFSFSVVTPDGSNVGFAPTGGASGCCVMYCPIVVADDLSMEMCDRKMHAAVAELDLDRLSFSAPFIPAKCAFAPDHK